MHHLVLKIQVNGHPLPGFHCSLTSSKKDQAEIIGLLSTRAVAVPDAPSSFPSSPCLQPGAAP